MNDMQAHSKQAGVGLLEVLIALLVFALGVVGMAGLQLRTLGMSIDSTQRSVVIAKSQDLADRIRSSGVDPINYVGTYDNTLCPATPANICADTESGNASSCDRLEMAAFDVWDVFCADRSSLDVGVSQWTTVIQCAGACAMGAQMTIDTTWESRTADTNADIADSSITNADGTVQNAIVDRLTLSFIP